MRSLLLIRHAESLSNAGVATRGADSIELSTKGLRQASRLADSLVLPEGRSRLVASPFRRAMATAEPIGQRLGQAVYALPLLTEFTFLAEPPLATTAAERRSAVHAYWLRADPLAREQGPFRESFEEFVHRVEAFHGWAQAQRTAVLVAVSHGLFIHAFHRLCEGRLFATAEGMSDLRRTFDSSDYPNAGVSEFSLRAGEDHWRRVMAHGA